MATFGQNCAWSLLGLISLWQTCAMVTSVKVCQTTKKRSGGGSAAKAKAGQRSRKDAASAGKSEETVLQGWVVNTAGAKSKESAKAAAVNAAYKAAAQSRSQDTSIEARRIGARSPAQVVALMKSAGILSATGKLTRSFK